MTYKQIDRSLFDRLLTIEYPLAMMGSVHRPVRFVGVQEGMEEKEEKVKKEDEAEKEEEAEKDEKNQKVMGE